MHTIRSFIAIPLSAAVSKNARHLVRELSREKDGIKWVPVDNLHLTLKFLGDVVDREVPAVCRAVRQVCSELFPFEIEFVGTGGFPSTDRPRVLWGGITRGGEELIELVSALEIALAELGFKPDGRDYRPHLTLGRVRSGSRTASADVIERLTKWAHRPLGEMRAEEVRIYASYLDKAGASYHVMDRVRLGEQSAWPSGDEEEELED